MRNRLLIGLLFFSLFGWGQVPDTNTFTLDTVVKVVNPATNDLSACFSAAVKANFDPLYDSIGYAPANSLLRFRNYQAIEAPCDTCYGLLYNWYAVNTGKLAPTGWHVPSQTEFETLRLYVASQGWNYDGTTDAGTDTDNKQAKALANDCGWESSSITGAVGNTDYPAIRNISGWSGLPTGHRRTNGEYLYIEGYGYWWSTSLIYSIAPVNYYICYADIYFYAGFNEKQWGLSIRCVRDAYEGWENDVPVVDYDGNEYDVVEIGTQLWLVQNLVTTHLNDGTAIPEVTDNSAWSVLTTPAFCAYDNDWSYACKTRP